MMKHLIAAALFLSTQLWTEEKTATILTWNIYGLPNELVALEPWEDRIDRIASTILQANADVVLLQECFMPALSLGLQDRLQKEYGTIHLDLGQKNGLRPSGLALFSKIPIRNFRFISHNDLLDLSRSSDMGSIDFTLVDTDLTPLAHIVASHFLGSSNYEWRTGKIDDGRVLSYAEIRQEEALAALRYELDEPIPQYLCGDLNVDRRSHEFDTSPLNSQINAQIVDLMSSDMQKMPTNTNFWKTVQGLKEMFPTLSQNQCIELAQSFGHLYETKLKDLLLQAPWDRPVAEFTSSFFDTLESAFDNEMLWAFFKDAAVRAIAKEKGFWQKNGNPGEYPPVSTGRVLEVGVFLFEESLDFILGTNPHAKILDVEILSGYDHQSMERSSSDHHPVKAEVVLGKKDPHSYGQ
jgi:endonuclease/exonuclease/phosphatase family metal-dependent hydrolase